MVSIAEKQADSLLKVCFDLLSNQMFLFWKVNVKFIFIKLYKSQCHFVAMMAIFAVFKYGKRMDSSENPPQTIDHIVSITYR